MNLLDGLIGKCSDLHVGVLKKNLVRWIFLLRSEFPAQPLFFECYATKKLIDQIAVDLKKSTDVAEFICDKISEYANFIASQEFPEDGNVSINVIDNVVHMQYYSKSLHHLHYPCNFGQNISIKNGIISFQYHSDRKLLIQNKQLCFSQYFRYLYLNCNNQTLAYDYSNVDPCKSIECFASPFNRHFNHFFSSFTEDIPLGAIGCFFEFMNGVLCGTKKLPVTDLKINPIFDEAFDSSVVDICLQLLETSTKYTMSFILPNWSQFEAKNKLLNSCYLQKYQIFKKQHIYFTNYFIGKKITPCDIIMLDLEN